LRKAAITRSTAHGSVNATRALSPSTGLQRAGRQARPGAVEAERESHGFLEVDEDGHNRPRLAGRPRG
jgi:hypothetical protein